MIGSSRTDIALNTDALNLANSDAHCRVIARTVEELANRGFSTPDNARDLLRNLIHRGTYGAFAELAAYEWTIRCNVHFATQVPLAPGEVLRINGSTLDGKIDCGPYYFDVKSFGFNGLLAKRLKEQLQKEFPNEEVHLKSRGIFPSKYFLH